MMNVLAVVLALSAPLLLVFAIGLLLMKKGIDVGSAGRSDSTHQQENLPMVSVLLPVRNEEENIITCLEAMCRMSYPKDRLEILIGNDHSEDQTRRLVADFIRDKPWFRLLDVGENIGFAKGKSNALVYLTRQAKGQYFLLTDADIVLPPNWIEAMVSGFGQENTGIVTGFTVIQGQSLFARLQSIDWLYSLGIVSQISSLGMPAVALGNNMAVTRQAYFATGGYENLPFSIIEDHQLLKAILEQGHGFKQFIDPQVTALTNPMPDFRAWLRQRKRWMNAAAQSIWPVRFFIFLQILFYPVVISLYFFNPALAIAILLSRLVLQAAYIEVFSLRVQSRRMGWQVLLLEVYTVICHTILLLYCLLPTKIRWKGRDY